MDQLSAEAYLGRIRAARPPRADVEALRELQLRHLQAVPFENLSIHLGEEIVLREQALFDKVVARRRGGFCYELNGLFAALLRALGFTVTLLAARANGRDGLGPLFDHLALRVDMPEPYLADVGFGRFSHHPLRLDAASEQADPDGAFRVVETVDGDLDVLRDGELQYRLERRPRTLADFEPTCWWHRTSPKSHFTRSLVCSRLSDGGRVTLSGRTLIETAGGDRRERDLGDDDEVLEAYRTHFGVVLDRVPSLRAVHDRDVIEPTTTPGGSAGYSVSVAGVNGFAGDVSLSLTGLSEAQATWGASPPVVQGGSGTAQLTVTTSGTISPGTYPLTITGTSGPTSHSVTASLVVPAPPDFALGVTPASRSVFSGDAATYAVGVSSLNGFAGDVALSLGGLPAGVGSASFTPATVAGAGSSTLRVTTSGSTPRGTFTLRVTGTSGSLSHQATATLTVR